MVLLISEAKIPVKLFLSLKTGNSDPMVAENQTFTMVISKYLLNYI